MFELPEILHLARQLDETIVGKTIAQVDVPASRPKLLFLSPDMPELAAELVGHRVRKAVPRGRWIFCALEDERTLLFGEFGGRLLFHEPGELVPPKRHWIATFDDGSSLSLAIQMWGFLGVLTPTEIARHPYAGTLAFTPLDTEFTEAAFSDRLDRHAATEDKPIKAFLTHSPNVAGIGNGYLQDILHRARLSPKCKVSRLSVEDRRALYTALRQTLTEAARLGGRDTERDLFDQPGRYTPRLDGRAVGRPCTQCGTLIARIQYLGGSCYVCPHCQE
ncbi:MAG: endonuclease VIII [Candidatus Bipolaricaulota bacterium]|nr:endonuclease VIII [Candidatus Bipolaricaulota bacterium]